MPAGTVSVRAPADSLHFAGSCCHERFGVCAASGRGKEKLKRAVASAMAWGKGSPPPRVYAEFVRAIRNPAAIYNPAHADTPEPAAPSLQQDPRVYFAAERTLLAWIRTGLALMGLGFAIARFGLFLREMQTATPAPVHNVSPSAGSAFTGIFLVLLGVVINIIGAVDYTRTIRQLSLRSWIPGRISKTAVGLAALLAVLGTVITIHLFLLP